MVFGDLKQIKLLVSVDPAVFDVEYDPLELTVIKSPDDKVSLCQMLSVL